MQLKMNKKKKRKLMMVTKTPMHRIKKVMVTMVMVKREMVQILMTVGMRMTQSRRLTMRLSRR